MARLLDFVARPMLLVVLALWLGGLVALFVFIQALFAHDRPTALAAGPVLFHVFDVYQRLLAAAAVVSAAVLAWRAGGASAWIGFGLVLLCAAGALVVAIFVMPEMQALTASGRTSGERFRWLHGLSMLIYTSESVLLLAALLLRGLTLGRRSGAGTPP